LPFHVDSKFDSQNVSKTSEKRETSLHPFQQTRFTSLERPPASPENKDFSFYVHVINLWQKRCTFMFGTWAEPE